MSKEDSFGRSSVESRELKERARTSSRRKLRSRGSKKYKSKGQDLVDHKAKPFFSCSC